MKELLEDYLRGVSRRDVKCTNFRMKIDRRKAQVSSSSVTKVYANDIFDKRVVINLHPELSDKVQNRNACTLPFGLRHYNFSDCDATDVFM